MRVFFTSRTRERIEDDERVSKCNFGSRQGYSVESAILEKRLLYESNIFTEEKVVHTISDLAACYDRQLANLCCLAEETVGVERNPCIVFLKLIPHFHHYVSTSFGISNLRYGGEDELLAGTGQGNVLSGNACRDLLCLIFKRLEKDELGVTLHTPITRQVVQRSAVAFVDDAVFFSNGNVAETKMQGLLRTYVTFYEAMAGKIKQEAVFSYMWR